MKSNKLRIILRITRSLFLLLVIISILFPPFFAIDASSKGEIHTGMGYFPIWNKPGNIDAFEILASSGMIDQSIEVSEADEINTNLDQFESHFNKIQFIFNLLVLIILMLVIRGLLKFLDKRIKADQQT